jgi:hypothetical protein
MVRQSPLIPWHLPRLKLLAIVHDARRTPWRRKIDRRRLVQRAVKTMSWRGTHARIHRRWGRPPEAEPCVYSGAWHFNKMLRLHWEPFLIELYKPRPSIFDLFRKKGTA